MNVFDSQGRRLLTIAQVANVRGVTVAAITKARQRGRLPEPAGWLDARTPLWLELDVIDSPIPAELRRLSRWVRRSDRKVPLTAAGGAASVTDPSTWSTFAAVAAGPGVGFGFVLNGDGIACIDLDHCIAPDGTLSTQAADLLALAGDTFVEVSPSGRGLHIWGRATVAAGRRRDGVEVYGTGRYIAVTGDRWRAAPSKLGDITTAVAAIT